MKADTAKIMVVVGTGIAVVGTTMKEILDGQRGPTFYVPLAGAIVAVPLLIVADFQPDLAGGMAVLILVAALSYSGTAIAEAMANASKSTVNKSQSRIGFPNPTTNGRTSGGPPAHAV